MPPTPPHRPKPPPTPPAQLAARIDAIIGTCAEVLAAIVLQAAVRLWRQRRRRAAAARALQRASRAYLRRSRPDVETRAVCAAAAARVMRSVLVRQAENIRAADARQPNEDREATCAHSPSASSLSAASPSASLPGTGASLLAARETAHSPGRTRAGVVIGRLGAATAHPDDPAAVAAASAAAAAAASRATGGATGASSRCLGSNGGSSSSGGGGVDGGGGSSGRSSGRWCVRNLDTGIAINVTQLEELYDEIYSEMPMGCGGAATQAQAASGPREAGAGAAGAADVAGAAGPLLITGVLLKRGKKLGQWTPRWFQLAVSGELTCYRQRDGAPQFRCRVGGAGGGSVQLLPPARLEQQVRDSGVFGFVLEYSDNNASRRRELFAESVETLEQWVRAFVLLGACTQPDELIDHGDDPGVERGGTELG